MTGWTTLRTPVGGVVGVVVAVVVVASAAGIAAAGAVAFAVVGVEGAARREGISGCSGRHLFNCLFLSSFFLLLITFSPENPLSGAGFVEVGVAPAAGAAAAVAVAVAVAAASIRCRRLPFLSLSPSPPSPFPWPSQCGSCYCWSFRLSSRRCVQQVGPYLSP